MNIKCPFCHNKMNYIKGLWYHCHCHNEHIYNSTIVIENKKIVDYHLPIAYNNKIYWVDSKKGSTQITPNIYPVGAHQFIQVADEFIPFHPDYQITFTRILKLKAFL